MSVFSQREQTRIMLMMLMTMRAILIQANSLERMQEGRTESRTSEDVHTHAHADADTDVNMTATVVPRFCIPGCKVGRKLSKTDMP